MLYGCCVAVWLLYVCLAAVWLYFGEATVLSFVANISMSPRYIHLNHPMRIITKVCPRHINLRQACRQTPKLIEIFKPISIHSFLVHYPHRIHHKTRAPSPREESPLLRSLLVPSKTIP